MRTPHSIPPSRALRACAYIVAILCLVPGSGGEAAARVLRVGPGQQFALPSEAAAAAQHGDTVEILAGEYVDCATWTRDDLLIRGVGGYAHVRDKSCGRKAIWVIQGRNTTVEWIEFSGATVQDRNGAGIRQEGAHLTLRHCSFHDNENGILAGDNAESRILIEHCVFDNNGYGDGYSHNMYINHIADFTIRFSHVHRARVGHNIKSRAYRTSILYNLITTGSDGTTSRAIDLPNGGLAVVLGNIIQHGPATQNSNLIGYGLEGLSNPIRSLSVASTTMVSARGAGAFIQTPATGTDTVRIVNCAMSGGGTVWNGGAVVSEVASPPRVPVAAAGFVDPDNGDFHLRASSPFVNTGLWRGTASVPLIPELEYLHPQSARPRPVTDTLDAGAYECTALLSAAGTPIPSPLAIDAVSPQPSDGSFRISLHVPAPGRVRIELWTLDGRRAAVVSERWISAGRSVIHADARDLPAGMYLLRCSSDAGTAQRTMLLLPR